MYFWTESSSQGPCLIPSDTRSFDIDEAREYRKEGRRYAKIWEKPGEENLVDLLE